MRLIYPSIFIESERSAKFLLNSFLVFEKVYSRNEQKYFFRKTVS